MDDRGRDRVPARKAPPKQAERLAAALRANLKRRKAQARGRAEAEEAVESAGKRLNRPNSDD